MTTATGDEPTPASLTAELSSLDARAVTDELLTRLAEVLGVDEGAVLLLDASSSQLVAYASHGLEEEVRQGIRVPVGRGFAGRVAVERQPVVLDDVGPDKVVNPLLYRTGLRTLLGVPLVAAGQLVGVLHVGSRTPRSFDADDIARVQDAADRIAISVVADQAADERRAARGSCSAACSPRRSPTSPACRSPRASSPPSRSVSAATGTTRSTCPRGRSASSSATSPATGCALRW
ncbi:MAG: GAF domain-containing protein [Ilumatobacteraceae bacterium]